MSDERSREESRRRDAAAPAGAGGDSGPPGRSEWWGRGFAQGGGIDVLAAVVSREERYTLSRPDPPAAPRSSIGHEVGGIVLKSEPVALDEWASRLAAALAQLANRNADAAAALARITSMEV